MGFRISGPSKEVRLQHFVAEPRAYLRLHPRAAQHRCRIARIGARIARTAVESRHRPDIGQDAVVIDGELVE